MSKKSSTEWSYGINLYFIAMNLLVFLGVTIISALISALLYRLFHLSVQIPEAVYMVVLSTVMGGVVTSFLYYKILAPISVLSKAMSRVASGDFNVTLVSESKIGQVKNLYRDFNLMAKELSATETLQTDFVSNVSHEFKTPLGAIEGYAALLHRDSALTSNQKEYIEKILLNTKRLSGLVSNILLLSKIENQAIHSKMELFRLDEQIRQAIVTLEPKWAKKNIDLTADLETVVYAGNESLLFHVWMNLIDNAIKFNPLNGNLRIYLRASEQNVLVSIQDSGCGILEADKKRIFDKFYQTDTSHKGEGNGLGLALVNRIVSIHQGRIEVENCAQGGCKFTTVLPIL